MPSKLGPHFLSGTPGRRAGSRPARVSSTFDPTSLGGQRPDSARPAVVGKLDQREDRLDLTDWKAYLNGGGRPVEVAAHRLTFSAPSSPAATSRAFDDPGQPAHRRLGGRQQVVPDNPDEARWYADYCIAMMGHYEAIGRRRANFCFAVGTPERAPATPRHVWPHLLPAIRHARRRPLPGPARVHGL